MVISAVMKIKYGDRRGVLMGYSFELEDQGKVSLRSWLAFGQRSKGGKGAIMRQVLWVEGTITELFLPNLGFIHFTLMKLLSRSSLLTF